MRGGNTDIDQVERALPEPANDLCDERVRFDGENGNHRRLQREFIKRNGFAECRHGDLIADRRIIDENKFPWLRIVCRRRHAHGFDEGLQFFRFHSLRLILPDAAAGENQFVKSHLLTLAQVAKAHSSE